MVGAKSRQLGHPTKEILSNKGPEITDMSRSIHSGTAAVKTEAFAIGGENRLLLPGQGVMKEKLTHLQAIDPKGEPANKKPGPQ